MYDFKWDFTEGTYERCKTENIGDYVGNVRTGNVCFDIIQIEDDGSLWIDCYVGGVDTGYGYSMTSGNYPYDYASEVGMSIERDWIINHTYQEFKGMVEKELTNSINTKGSYRADNGEVVNIIDKANEPLRVW